MKLKSGYLLGFWILAFHWFSSDLFKAVALNQVSETCGGAVLALFQWFVCHDRGNSCPRSWTLPVLCLLIGAYWHSCSFGLAQANLLMNSWRYCSGGLHVVEPQHRGASLSLLHVVFHVVAHNQLPFGYLELDVLWASQTQHVHFLSRQTPPSSKLLYYFQAHLVTQNGNLYVTFHSTLSGFLHTSGTSTCISHILLSTYGVPSIYLLYILYVPSYLHGISFIRM